MTNTKQLIAALESAISQEDKQTILQLYDEFEMVDWEQESAQTGEYYNELVGKANDILYKD